MAYIAPKYEGQDFLEWYKANFGTDYQGGGLTRAEGMNDIDWDIGNELFSAYQRGEARGEQYSNDSSTLLDNYNTSKANSDAQYNAARQNQEASYQKNTGDLLRNYDASIGALDTSKKNALQGASITYDKLKKYLPTQVKAQGLGGLGVSESTLLQAHNNYNTQRGSIENAYNANKASLDNAYNTNKSSLDTEHENSMRELASAKEASDTERDTSYNNAVAQLLNLYNADMQSIKDGINVGGITADYQKKNRELQQGNYEDLAALFSGMSSEDIQDFLAHLTNADINSDQMGLLRILAENQSTNNRTNRQQADYSNFEKSIAALLDMDTSSAYVAIEALDIPDEMKARLKQQVDSKVAVNNDNRRKGIYDNYVGIISKLTDMDTSSAYAAIDKLDITAEQKAQLKALVDSKVATNIDNHRNDMIAEFREKYNNFYYGDDFTNAKKVLDSYKQFIPDSEYQTKLQDIQNGVKKQEEAEAEEKRKKQEEKDKRIVSGQETFQYNGGTYQITSQLKSDANEIKRNNDFKDQLKKTCGTDNPYDTSKIPNGTTFTIKCDNRGSNDFNFWDDIGAFLLSPLGAGAWDSWGNWNTVYVTFYNGQWYKCDKKV